MNIYKITNNITNKCYIGLTINDINNRFYHHCYTAINNGGFYLHRSMRKHGIENFTISLIDTAENLEDLKNKEIHYISEYNTYNDGYNLTKGGDFSSNTGKVVVINIITNEIKQIDVLEYMENDNYISVNKNKITIYKEGNKIRTTPAEYKNIYFEMGWRSKNFGYTTAYNENGIITKIRNEDFDKSKHKGVNVNKQIYFNSVLNKYELSQKDEVDVHIHYSKNKNRYKVFDSDNNLLEIVLCADNISKNNGFSQFRYMLNRKEENQTVFILSEEILKKLKNKSRDFSLINYKLIIETI